MSSVSWLVLSKSFGWKKNKHDCRLIRKNWAHAAVARAQSGTSAAKAILFFDVSHRCLTGPWKSHLAGLAGSLSDSFRLLRAGAAIFTFAPGIRQDFSGDGFSSQRGGEAVNDFPYLTAEGFRHGLGENFSQHAKHCSNSQSFELIHGRCPRRFFGGLLPLSPTVAITSFDLLEYRWRRLGPASVTPRRAIPIA